MSEERRKEIAMALALRDGHQPEDFVDWQKTIYAKRADEIIGQEVGEFTDVPCEKCGGRGFTEQEHGLVMVLCDCEKGEVLRAETTVVVEGIPVVSIGGGAEIPDSVKAVEGLEVSDDKSLESREEKIQREAAELAHKTLKERQDDNSRSMDNSGYECSNGSPERTERIDSPTGGGDTSQPQLKQKPKSKKKARKKSG